MSPYLAALIVMVAVIAVLLMLMGWIWVVSRIETFWLQTLMLFGPPLIGVYFVIVWIFQQT